MAEGQGGGGFPRRRFIQSAVALGGGALLGGSGLLDLATASAAKPKTGGMMTAGISGGGSQDTLDGFGGVSNIDLARNCQLFESLADVDHEFNVVPMLGTEFTPNASGDEMTVRLRPDVTFHNGKPLTSADVVYSYNYILNPKITTNVGPLFAGFLESVAAVDRLTVRFKFKFPFNSFAAFAALPGARIVPPGYDPKKPIGTGPFKYQSFTPGQQSVFTKNEDYWGVGLGGERLPYVDAITLVDLSTDSSRVAALVSGVVDAIDSVPYALLPAVKSNAGVAALISETGNWYPITMRVDRAPFDDVRVRQAFRLMVDRPQMVAEAYGNQAALGNDLFANTDPLYDRRIPQRVQDIEQARFLLKKAGRDGMTIDLVTADIENGVVQSCVVFAQQAKAAGVNVQITKLDNTAFYNSQYLERVFSVDSWPTLQWVVDVAYSCVAGATYNDTHWNNPQFNKWYLEFVAAKSESLQREIADEMQEMLWNEGGEIIPGIPNEVDAYSRKVTGFVPDKSGQPLSFYRFKDAWFV
jgi:peptide/nickel transport system substrate-binding protein